MNINILIYKSNYNMLLLKYIKYIYRVINYYYTFFLNGKFLFTTCEFLWSAVFSNIYLYLFYQYMYRRFYRIVALSIMNLLNLRKELILMLDILVYIQPAFIS
jgi:hypothetical protein